MNNKFHIKSPVLNFVRHPWLYSISVYCDEKENFYMCPDFVYALFDIKCALFDIKGNNSIRLHFQSTPCPAEGYEICVEFYHDDFDERLSWRILSELPAYAERFIVGDDVYITLFRELHKLIETTETTENPESKITGWLWIEIVE